MSDIKITINSQQVDALLLNIHGKLANPQPILSAIGQSINQNIRLTFRDLKSPDGQPWQQLSPVTIGRRKNKTSVPLNDTGNLRRSIAYQLSGQSIEIGTNVRYAATMNFGAKQGQFGKNKRNSHIPWGNIPARPFMPAEQLPVVWENEIVTLIKNYLLVND